MIIITIISLVVAVGLTFLDVPLWAKTLAIAAAVSITALGFLKESAVASKLTSIKQFKSRHLLVAAFFVFLLAVNTLLRVYEHVWDYSRTHIYSLRKESVDWIGKIKNPMTVHIFLRSDDKTSAYVDWLKNSAYSLGNKLDIQVHNINRDLTLADKFGIHKVGETVLESGPRWVKVDDFKEATLIKGIVRLHNREGSSVCFSVDHGEPDISDTTPAGLSLAAAAAKDVGYGVRTVSLRSSSDIETSCSLLVIVAPQSDFFPEEARRLSTLLGHLPILLAAGPNMPPSLSALFQEKGLGFGKLLVDQENLERHVPLTDVQVNLGESEVLSMLRGNIYLPQVQSLNLVDMVAWHSALSTPYGKVTVEDDIKNVGPFVVIAAMLSDDGIKALVVGSNKPFLNVNWRYASNGAAFVNLMQTLAAESDVKLPDYGIVDEPIMEMTDYQSQWIRGVVIYGLPAIMLMLCAGIWIVHCRVKS